VADRPHLAPMQEWNQSPKNGRQQPEAASPRKLEGELEELGAKLCSYCTGRNFMRDELFHAPFQSL
jgi:hypothetical protein